MKSLRGQSERDVWSGKGRGHEKVGARFYRFVMPPEFPDSQLFHGPAPRSPLLKISTSDRTHARERTREEHSRREQHEEQPLHRLAIRLRHSRSNTSTEYSLPGATQLSQVRPISPSGQGVPFRVHLHRSRTRFHLIPEFLLYGESETRWMPVIPYSQPSPQGKPCTAPSHPICPAATTRLVGATTANRSRDGSFLQE